MNRKQILAKLRKAEEDAAKAHEDAEKYREQLATQVEISGLRVSVSNEGKIVVGGRYSMTEEQARAFCAWFLAEFGETDG